MKHFTVFLFLIMANGYLFGQKTMMVEKIGTSRKYYYHIGDYLKLRVSAQDTILKGKLWEIQDSSIAVSELRPFDVRLCSIGSVYKQFAFPKKLGTYLGFFSAGLFVIIVANHLINKEQVFTPDLFIISGSVLGGSLISFSLSQKRCKIGHRWKVKVLNIPLYKN